MSPFNYNYYQTYPSSILYYLSLYFRVKLTVLVLPSHVTSSVLLRSLNFPPPMRRTPSCLGQDMWRILAWWSLTSALSHSLPFHTSQVLPVCDVCLRIFSAEILSKNLFDPPHESVESVFCQTRSGRGSEGTRRIVWESGSYSSDTSTLSREVSTPPDISRPVEYWDNWLYHSITMMHDEYLVIPDTPRQ